MKLSPASHQFFDRYLPHIKGVSEHTLKAYRDAFKLFLLFAAEYYGIKIKSLRLEQITSELLLAFLDDLQSHRHNLPRTRNQRLAALKSFAKMIRLLYPDQRHLAETIFSVPQKRTQKPLIGFLYPEEILKVFHVVNLKRKEGPRDYALLHLLFDSGARASEVATLNLDYFNPEQKTLAILGKGNRFRLIELEPKTTQLLQLYIARFRPSPKPLFQQRLFVNQRGEELTRYGIYRLCRKYLHLALLFSSI
jgi:integrase/recombinase XerD